MDLALLEVVHSRRQLSLRFHHARAEVGNKKQLCTPKPPQ